MGRRVRPCDPGGAALEQLRELLLLVRLDDRRPGPRRAVGHQPGDTRPQQQRLEQPACHRLAAGGGHAPRRDDPGGGRQGLPGQDHPRRLAERVSFLRDLLPAFGVVAEAAAVPSARGRRDAFERIASETGDLPAGRVIRLEGRLSGQDAEQEAIPGVVKTELAARVQDPHSFLVDQVKQDFEVVSLTDKTVVVIDDQMRQLPGPDVREHPVPAGTAAAALPR